MAKCSGKRKSNCRKSKKCSWRNSKCKAKYSKKRKSSRKGSRKGKKRVSRRGSAVSCKGRSESKCGSNPNCSWTKKGCKRRRGVLKGSIFQGPMLPDF